MASNLKYESNLYFGSNYEGQGTAKVTTRVKWKCQFHNIEFTSRHENKKFWKILIKMQKPFIVTSFFVVQLMLSTLIVLNYHILKGQQTDGASGMRCTCSVYYVPKSMAD